MTHTLPVLRRSAIQTAQACLYRYKKIWIDGVPDQSDLSLKGIGFHACAHQYILRLLSIGQPADAEEAQQAFTAGVASALTPAHLIYEVRQLFLGWAERFELDLGAFVGSEEHQIGDTEQTFTPDLVYARPHELEIKDWKTYWHPLTEEQIRKDFQARFYTFNAMRIWPNFSRYRFTHAYVRFGTEVSVVFEPGDLDTFRAEVEAVAAVVAEATDTGEWPATAGVECQFCELQCPLADNPALVPKRFTLPEQASLVAAWVLAAEQQLKTAKAALKSYCAANGPVDVKGIEFANRPVEQRSYPVDKVLAAMERLGIGKDSAALGSSLTLSHSALAKLFKSYPALEDAVRPDLIQSTSYRFGAKKYTEGTHETHTD